MPFDVGVVAYDCFTPLGLSIGETWEKLIRNCSGVREIDRYDAASASFDVRNVSYGGQLPCSFEDLAGSQRKLKKWPEPCFHAVRRLSADVLAAINFSDSKHDPQRIGILGGTALTSQISLQRLLDSQKPNINFILSQCQNTPLAAVGIDFDLQGPSFAIDSACASSSHAVLVAAQLINAGLLDCVLVCGYEFPFIPATIAGFSWLTALYKRDNPRDRGFANPAGASRPFSCDRRGFVPSEATVVALLSDQNYARKNGWPIHATIQGGYANSDAYHLTKGNNVSLATCMQRALSHAGCQPTDVECVHAHATSTSTGDAVELNALQSVFGQLLSTLHVVASKSQLGHSLGAAGLLSVVLAIEGMRKNAIPPTLNFTPDPELPRAMISRKSAETRHKTTLVNSFGFGGTNVSLVVSQQ